jgi:phosphoglycerate dehydrogenase-like enzyme
LIGWNRTPRAVEGVELTDLETLFGRADIVTVHTASTPDTYQLVNAERLAAMRDGAILINTARGAIVEESALVRELASGRLRAGLDVFAEEPLPQDSPLMQLDNVVFTPHLGSATGATREAMIGRALENLSAGMTRTEVPWRVMPD